jgi:hypothetical protein
MLLNVKWLVASAGRLRAYLKQGTKYDDEKNYRGFTFIAAFLMGTGSCDVYVC